MSLPAPTGSAFNRTRGAYLATELSVAGTHWSRFVGLMATAANEFSAGRGLWITPSHGVHTLAMRFPIDVIYLDNDGVVVHAESELRPWRVAPVRRKAASVLELPPNTLRATQTGIGDRIEISVRRAGQS
jgi:uncharacterized membrane protein (UPF0127 family)